jgi:hypothetical protein
MAIPDHPYRPLIEQVCEDHPPLPADVLEAMVWVESNFVPSAKSRSNAIGLAQIIYKWHAPTVSLVCNLLGKKDTGELALYDPEVNLTVAAKHLRWCFGQCGTWEGAVRKYHLGDCAPPDDAEDGQGTTSDAHIAKFRAAITEVTAFRSQQGTTPMATHRFILSAGHRNTDRGGARNEINWTYHIWAKSQKASIEARGGKAWIIQEEDGDNDPSFCVGRGLQNAAQLCVNLAKAVGGVDAYVSGHYNGGASPGFHAIFPDARSGVDVKANNPLDVRLSRTIRDKVKATGTVNMLAWTADSPGVMSEKETGVGAQGYRLGEFVGTLGFRDTTARVIVEAGSIDTWEIKHINDINWVRNVYCEAITDALEEVFGKFSDKPVPAPTPEPKPEPVPAYPAPLAIPELDKFKSGDLIEIPSYVDFGDGYRAFWVGDRVRGTAAQKRLRKYDGSEKELTGDWIPVNEEYDVDWLITRPGDTGYHPMYRTPYGTHVWVQNSVRIADVKAA